MRADDSSTTWRWGVHRLGVLGLVGTLLAVMLASSATATGAPRAGAADPPPYLANATDPAVTTLAADLGISIREAQRRMGWQEPAMEMAGELERALGDRYGDLWFDPADGGRVKVGIVGGDTALAARLIARRKLTTVTDLVPVRHSYAELKQAAAWLDAEVTRANPPARNGLVKGLSVWRLPDRNMVELDLPRGQRLTTAQQATVAAARQRLGSRLILGTWAGQTRDLSCAWGGGEFDCDPPLRGGVMMYLRNSQGGYDPECTVGFNAKSTVDGKWYVLTAGHCGYGPGTTFYVYQRRTGQFHVLGHMHRCIWGGRPSCVYAADDDEGIITIDNVPGWDPKPWVYVHAWTGPVPDLSTTTNPSYPIYGTGGSKLGMRVCVSGAIKGTSCGYVEQLGGGSLAQVDLCADHGDSGAPIFAGQKALGLLKGANPDETGKPPPACTDRLYQGITEATQRLHVAVALGLP